MYLLQRRVRSDDPPLGQIVLLDVRPEGLRDLTVLT